MLNIERRRNRYIITLFDESKDFVELFYLRFKHYIDVSMIKTNPIEIESTVRQGNSYKCEFKITILLRHDYKEIEDIILRWKDNEEGLDVDFDLITKKLESKELMVYTRRENSNS